MGMSASFTPIPAGCVADVTKDASLISSDYGDKTLDIDKSWHGIHYLLTGTAYEGDEPLSLLIMGGEQIDDDGHRILSPEQVMAIVAVLPMEESLKTRFDPQRMTDLEIYPQIWDEGEESLDYLTANYVELAEFFRGAADRRDAVAVFIG